MPDVTMRKVIECLQEPDTERWHPRVKLQTTFGSRAVPEPLCRLFAAGCAEAAYAVATAADPAIPDAIAAAKDFARKAIGYWHPKLQSVKCRMQRAVIAADDAWFYEHGPRRHVASACRWAAIAAEAALYGNPVLAMHSETAAITDMAMAERERNQALPWADPQPAAAERQLSRLLELLRVADAAGADAVNREGAR